MEDTKKPLYMMILFALVRHGLQFVGDWALAHHVLTPDIVDRMLGDSNISFVVGCILTALAVLWAVAQKTQVWNWVKTALHLDGRVAGPSDALKKAPGPNIPV